MTIYATGRPNINLTGAGSANTYLNVFGGTGCLHDDNDDTYLQVFDLDELPDGQVLLAFNAVDFEGTGAPDPVPVQFRARYEQTAGSSAGAPRFTLTDPFAATFTIDEFASIGDGIVEVGSSLQTFARSDFEQFTEWSLTIDHVGSGPCEFHLIEVWLVFRTPLGISPLRRWPPVNHSIRHWPRGSGRRVGKSF